jgi:hypothetical protein
MNEYINECMNETMNATRRKEAKATYGGGCTAPQ